MKKRIFKILSIILCGILLSSSTLVSAKTVDVDKSNNKVIKSRVKDNTGKEIIEYYNVDILPESRRSSNNSIATLDFNNTRLGVLNYNLTLASTEPLVYTSNLSGAYSNYTQCIASSDATRFIDRIYCSVQAWLAAGTYVGQDAHTNPDGWTTMNQTAFLAVPVNPFNYQFGSAVSQHAYTCTGYEYVYRSLTWNK